MLEKSQKIGKYRRYFGEISESGRHIGRNIDTWETRAWETFFAIFWEIYRRYIENIGDIFDISVDISVAASVAQICCAENPTAQIKPPFQTASLTDLVARFESGLIQRPRFHPDLKCDPTVKFLIQRPEIKSKLDPTAED